MKKALLTLLCLTAMLVASTSLKAQEVTIVLIPGYNWISIPCTDTLDFATALGSFTPAEGDVIKSQWSNAVYRNGHWVGQISQFYPGYGYMYKSNRAMPVSLTFNAQQPSPQVVVTTSEPMLITAISAMGGGEVTVNDGTYIIVKGLCWATHENPTTNDDFYQEAESGVGSFSISMTDLNISTTYYVRAYAVTPNETVYGNQKTFTTRDGIPEVSTASITEIIGDGATCGGTVTDNGGLTVISRGVCWSILPNPTINDNHTTNGSGLGSFTSIMTGMNGNTTYYVRAYACTNFAISYGEEVGFITGNIDVPTVTTSVISDITQTTAIGGGNVINNGGANSTERGICWSTSYNPTIADSHVSNGAGIGSYMVNMFGLVANTTYYVRAYALNSAGICYGNEVSFTTLSGAPPEATDFTATDINGNEIHLFDILDQGQAVLINFFFDCGPAQQAMPKIVESYYAMGCNMNDVFYMEISDRGNDAACQTWSQTYGVEFPTISGTAGGTSICSTYGIAAYPTVILIMPNHQIVIQDLWPIYNAQTIINTLENQGLEQHDCNEQ